MTWSANRANRRWRGVDTAAPGSRGSASGAGLAFAQAEGDEAVARVVWGEADRHAVARNHSDPKAAHATRQLGRDRLPALELDLVLPPAENLLDRTVGRNQVITRQTQTPFSGRAP